MRLWKGGHKESMWAASRRRIKQENEFSSRAGSSIPGQHQLLGNRQVPVCYLLETVLHAAGEQWESEWCFFTCPSPSLPWPPEPPPCPQPGKNGLPRNQSLVPKRLGTAALNHWSFCLWLLALWPWSWASTGLVDLWGAAQHRSQRVGHDQVTSLTFSVLLLLIFIVISAAAFRSSASLKQCSCDAPPPFSLVLIYWLGVLGFRSLFYTLHFLSVHFLAHPYV